MTAQFSPGPPGPPEAPKLTLTNMTAIKLTWAAPWPFPVSNYTITMLNLSSGQESQWTTFEERFVLMGGEEGQCGELQFTVEAKTDVGRSGPSPNTTGGFPIGDWKKTTTLLC